MGGLRVEPDNAGRTNRRQLVISLRWLVVAALVAVLAVGAGWLGWAVSGHRQQESASAQALQAAKDYTNELANIDYGTVDKSLDDLRSHTTDKLNALHTKDGERIRKIIVDKKVTARGEIVEATIVSATKDRVTVELLVDQMVADIDTPEPDTERNRVTITMDRIDGRWLASDVEL